MADTDVKMEDAGDAPQQIHSPGAAESASVKIEDTSRVHFKSSHSPATPGISPSRKADTQETVGGGITLKMEPGQAPKLSRRASQKIQTGPAQLFTHLPDATPDATSTFEVINACNYAAKYLGYTEPPLECDCSEEWDAATQTNHACGEDSDCINRATKMECNDADCSCGAECQNQRFQRRLWADVSVIKTEKKGFGLRANTDLKPNDFIFEYIGEVIGEPAFRRRMHQYDEEGIKHFYFMSLTKGEFVDATKKGNLGRFCNHSCNPNCYVDKWVVGEKLRMGIFAERHVKAGEELVFNYNVDRYGADPQPCYCGEPNCVGFIGGKTQTGGAATKLAWHVVEALGLEDAEDWDSAVTKKPRKRKTEEDDEEYVNNVQPKALDQVGVRKVMATLATCKEKWIAAKLLSRIQDADDENIRFQVIKMHGYRILNNVLKAFESDIVICQQICDILSRFPMLTRNKIHDSGIEVTMQKIANDSTDDDLKAVAITLTDKWSKLEMGFRIRKVKRDPNAMVEEKKVDRRDVPRERARSRSRSRSRSVDAPRGPSGPRGGGPPRGSGFGRSSQSFRSRPGALPDGWFQAVAANGSTYYYNATGTTTWQRPSQPALNAPPPPPPKAKTDQEVLQNLINSIITKKVEEKPQEQPPAAETPEVKKERKEDRWKSYPEEKRRKLYENTLFPHISYVMNKYKKHLSRDDLKKFGKQISKKLVESDFRKGRVGDPRKKLDHKQEKMVKTYVKEFFDKAVQKTKERRKSEGKHGDKAETTAPESTVATAATTAEEDVVLSDNEVEEDEAAEPAPPTTLGSNGVPKRPHEGEDDEADDQPKRVRTEEESAPPPPPPPPPPEEDMNRAGIEVDEPAKQQFAMDATLPKANGYSTDITGVSPMQIVTPPTTGSEP